MNQPISTQNSRSVKNPMPKGRLNANDIQNIVMIDGTNEEIPAKHGQKYKVTSPSGQDIPATELEVKRSGDDLVIHHKQHDSLITLKDYFDEGIDSPLLYQNPNSTVNGYFELSDSIASNHYADLIASNNDVAAAVIGSSAIPEVWYWLFGGAAVAGVAIAAGGSSGGSGGDNEAPAITSGAITNALTENSGANQVIYTATATDNTAVTTYSLTGTDAAQFTIDSVTGKVTLIANPDYETQSAYHFEVVAKDAAGNSSSQAVTLNIKDLNDNAPIAVDDSANATEDTAFTSTIALTANDTDIDSSNLTAVAGTYTTAQGGTLVLAADGSYTYTPKANFNGTDTVDYTVTDGALTDVGTLTLNVAAVNDAPIAVDDSENATEDTAFTSTIALTANDTDIDSSNLTAVAGTYTTAQGGTLVLAADGSYTYTPKANFNGTDTVDYTVTDGALTDVGTLTLNVAAVNDAPIAVDDSANATEDTAFTSTIALTANDTDIDSMIAATSPPLRAPTPPRRAAHSYWQPMAVTPTPRKRTSTAPTP